MRRGVAISGKAGAGKSTLADLVRAELDERAVATWRLSFAAAVKKEVRERYGLEKGMPGAREKLIQVGHGRRVQNPDYWIRQLMPAVSDVHLGGGLAVIDDVRYGNELEWLKECGFVTVRIDVDESIRAVRLLEQGEDPAFAASTAPSECELDTANFEIRAWVKNVAGLQALAPVIADAVARDRTLDLTKIRERAA